MFCNYDFSKGKQSLLFLLITTGVRRGGREALAPLDFENFSKKKVVFLVLSGKKQILPLLASPLEKF